MSSRITYPLYRCEKCSKLITRRQIRQRWALATHGPKPDSSICNCGSRRISPSNATLWEELTSPAIWIQAITDRTIHRADPDVQGR